MKSEGTFNLGSVGLKKGQLFTHWVRLNKHTLLPADSRVWLDSAFKGRSEPKAMSVALGGIGINWAFEQRRLGFKALLEEPRRREVVLFWKVQGKSSKIFRNLSALFEKLEIWKLWNEHCLFKPVAFFPAFFLKQFQMNFICKTFYTNHSFVR